MKELGHFADGVRGGGDCIYMIAGDRASRSYRTTRLTSQSQSRQQDFGGFSAQADRMSRALRCAAEVPISLRDTKVRHSLHTQRSQKEQEAKNISLCGQTHRANKLTCPSRLVPLAVDSNTCVGDSVD